MARSIPRFPANGPESRLAGTEKRQTPQSSDFPSGPIREKHTF